MNKNTSRTIVLTLTIVILSIRCFSQQIDSIGLQISRVAIELTKVQVIYDPTYVILSYPNGDVPWSRGVCTDVLIRAYRKLGIDLQKEVHEDMLANFHLYPKTWGLTKPDPNIDHRRVPNLMVFFSRFGDILPITTNPFDYKPGDIVAWDLGSGLTHIGIVIDKNLIVHNIGNGQEISDCLFSYRIIGHYKYPKSIK